MPSNIIKSWSKDLDIPESKMEEYWEKSIKIAEDSLSKTEDDFDDNDYAYVVGILKNMIGYEDSTNESIEDFLNSDINAKKYIETMTSIPFTAVMPEGGIVNKNKDDDIDEEDIDGVNIDMDDVEGVQKPRRRKMQDIIDIEIDDSEDDEDIEGSDYYNLDSFVSVKEI